MPRLVWTASISMMILCLTSCGRTDVEPPNLVVESKEQPAPQPAPQAADPAPKKEEKKPDPQSAPAPKVAAFQFADDPSGKILVKLLIPSAPPKIPDLPARQATRRIVPSFVIDPEVPFSNNVAIPARLPLQILPTPRPAPLPDTIPISMARTVPEIPGKIVMPQGDLVKVPAPDLHKPVSLPILSGGPSPDRASLEDATIDFSRISVSRAALPLRTAQAPFVKVNLPDPFELARSAQIRTIVRENPSTALGNPPLPRPILK